MALQDSDNLIIGRGETPYKTTYSNLKTDIKTETDAAYLSKVNDDTAAGKITFNENATFLKHCRSDEFRTETGSGGGINLGDGLLYGARIFSTNSISAGGYGETLQVDYRGTVDQTNDFNNIRSVANTNVSSTKDVALFGTTPVGQTTAGNYIGYRSNLDLNANDGSGETYNFYADGTAPNFFNGDIQCSTSINTFNNSAFGGFAAWKEASGSNQRVTIGAHDSGNYIQNIYNDGDNPSLSIRHVAIGGATQTALALNPADNSVKVHGLSGTGERFVKVDASGTIIADDSSGDFIPADLSTLPPL